MQYKIDIPLEEHKILRVAFQDFKDRSLAESLEQLKFMAKTEGGIGLEQGIVNFERIASEIHFLSNATQVALSSLKLNEKVPETRASVAKDSIEDLLSLEPEDSFEHKYEDEERLYAVLNFHSQQRGNLAKIKLLMQELNQQMRLNYQNKREELNYLYES